MAGKTSAKANEWADRLGIVGSIIALVVGVLLVFGVVRIPIDLLVGVALIVVGILGILKKT